MKRRITQIAIGIVMSLANFPAIANANEPAVSQIAPRYRIHGDTIYDAETNLTWMRYSVGQQWSKSIGCNGAVQSFTFDATQDLKNAKWRVPTKEELETLIVDNPKHPQEPFIDEAFQVGMNAINMVYWTSTSYDASVAWYVNFDDGRSGFTNRNTTFAVRLVRSGK